SNKLWQISRAIVSFVFRRHDESCILLEAARGRKRRFPVQAITGSKYAVGRRCTEIIRLPFSRSLSIPKNVLACRRVLARKACPLPTNRGAGRCGSRSVRAIGAITISERETMTPNLRTGVRRRLVSLAAIVAVAITALGWAGSAMAASHDFNGDHKSDILWWRTVSG